MRKECPGGSKRPLSEIDGDIAKIKAEIEEEYCLLGKAVCEIADQDAGKIGRLVDKLVELKNEHNTKNKGRKDENER